MEVVNERKNRVNVQRDCDLVEVQLQALKERVLQSTVLVTADGSSASDLTVQTFASRREVVAVAQDFTANQKCVIGRVIRERVFRKHKITTKKSFECGEIQKVCHSQLDASLQSEQMMAAHRDCLVKLVNLELTQKRNQVNKKLLKEWASKWNCCVTVWVLSSRVVTNPCGCISFVHRTVRIW
jgi:hypothetical protein